MVYGTRIATAAASILSASFFSRDTINNKQSILLAILDGVQQGVIIVNSDFVVCYVNPAYSRLFHLSAESIVGHSLDQYELLEKMSTVMRDKAPIGGDVSHMHGSDMDVYADIFPLLYKKMMIGVVACMNNVTQTMKHSQDLDYYRNLNTLLSEQLSIKSDLPIAFRRIICRNATFINLLQKAARAAPTNAAVCVSGEGGVGKELIAEAIHYSSKRSNGPIVKIHCAAIPERLFESELFGYEKGALSGAQQNGKLGKFELANRGTLFLDEIADMPMSMQVKLLRVLQEKEIERIGGTHRVKVDFRLITATNKDLASIVASGKFREDLYYRLNVIPVQVPPLRDRREDIPELANLFLEDLHKAYGRKVVLSKSALSALSAYDWPGNVRELKNLLEQIYILLPDSATTIDLSHLPVKIAHQPQMLNNSTARSSFNLNDIIERAEKDAITSALQMTNNNRTQAIDILGISRRNFYLKLKKYTITK